MGRLIRSFSVVLLTCGVCRLAAAEEVLICPRLQTAPAVDGRLDDAAWAKALRLEGFSRLGAGTPARNPTTVLLAYDDAALYVGFTCHETQVKALRQHPRARDRGTFDDDCVEIMIDPDPSDPATYYHFIANAAGSQYDADARSAAWNPAVPWQSVAKVGENAWTMEIAVPFRALPCEAPRRGHLWRLNFMRENYASPENSTWVPNPTGNLDHPMAMRFFTFGSRNLIVNGNFEARPDGAAIPGWQQGITKGAEGDSALEEEQGNHSARVRKTNNTGEVDLVQVIGLQQNTDYVCRMRVRYDTAPRGGYVFARTSQPQIYEVIQGRSDGWRKVDLRFNSGNETQTAVNGHFGYAGGSGTLFMDDVEVVALPYARDPNLRCLTGNGPAESASPAAAGAYRYYRAGTMTPFFPETGEKGAPEAPIPFPQGALTDNAPTAVDFTHGKGRGQSLGDGRMSLHGRDIVFDLGQDYFIREVVVQAASPDLSNVLVFVRPGKASRCTLVGSSNGRPLGGADEGLAYLRVNGLDSAAREVRVRVQSGGRAISLSEVQLWGEPLGRHRPDEVRALVPPKTRQAAPVSRALPAAGGDWVICPQPQEMTRLAGSFTLGPSTRILLADGENPRTRRRRSPAPPVPWMPA